MGSRDVLTKPPRLVLRLLQRGVVFIFTLLGRITQAASVFVFRVFLTLVTAYLIFYFFMNSTYLRDLLWKTMNDEAFKAWAQKAKRDISPMNGEETEKALVKVLNQYDKYRPVLEKYIK